MKQDSLTIKLRPYQEEAVTKCIDHFKVCNDPAVVVLPTGAGKSIVIAKIASLARGRVLILAHVKELVEQNHQKFISMQLKAGIFSASLKQKSFNEKIIFGSIQSVARAPENFFDNFTLLIIDECHRLDEDLETQYQQVIHKLRANQANLKILGLTATPFRLQHGWIYKYNSKGEEVGKADKFWNKCIYELPLSYMIKNKFLTPPVKIDIPITCYDFSELTQKGRMYTSFEVEELLKNQKRLTPLIVKNIIDISEKFQRRGIMIFCANIAHAQEVLSYLPPNQSALIIGDTQIEEREQTVQRFKNKEILYLVNVSVLTTGFDAPHVDVIAIMRPTESNGLYQQIIGRGLRLDSQKKECFILDYTGMGHDIYTPDIAEKKPNKDSTIVSILCPECNEENFFWGIKDSEGEILEHYGRKCACGYRFRYKLCPSCQHQNDIAARKCSHCDLELIDADKALKEAKLSKEAHVLIPDQMIFEIKKDRKGNEFLEIKYFDLDSNHLSEFYFFNHFSSEKKFMINFVRYHAKKPEQLSSHFSIRHLLQSKNDFRMPSFIIARKKDKFWAITEKIFTEHLNS